MAFSRENKYFFYFDKGPPHQFKHVFPVAAHLDAAVRVVGVEVVHLVQQVREELQYHTSGNQIIFHVVFTRLLSRSCA